ncbi:MAG: Ig-like domain repeat protein [Terriglobales bacterium]
MLLLPTGQIMFTDFSSDVEILTESGTYQSAWQPTISSVPAGVSSGQTYTISGTQFNGLSEGSEYGDDFQNSTNYPLVRIVNNATQDVFYCKTHNPSTMGVATGSTIVSVSFDVPAILEQGPSELFVVANGIPSAGVAVAVEYSTSTSLTSSPNPSTYTQLVNFTASVASVGENTPSGTVEFTTAGTDIFGCSAVGLTSGTAVCPTSTLPAGTHAIVAIYSGDVNDVGSTSITVPQVVNLASTSTALISSPNPSTVGQSVSFTATVSGAGGPTGTVAFSSNSTAVAGCSKVVLNSGTAICTTTALAAGSDTIAAAYSGDNNNASSGGTLTQVVNNGAMVGSATALTSSLNPSNAGQTVTFLATVTPAGPPAPTGTVGFTADGIIISGCSAVSVSSAGAGAAACTSSALTAGTVAIVATYSGDTNYSGSSGALSQVVAPNETVPGIITTFAGCCEATGGPGTRGYSGDGGPATVADLAGPNGAAAMDSAGNLYIADNYNSVIRSVNAAGTISTLAGGATAVCAGATDSIGDGCPATSADLTGPSDVAVDSAGNFYIADSNNNRIRIVSKTTGIITTMAGDGNFTVCAGATDSIGDGCPATSASLYLPEGVAVDSAGNLYIADFDDCVIRKVTASTGKITTVAGTSTGAGTFANCGYSGDGGPATSAKVNNVYRVVLDSTGNLYIADYVNQVIRVVNTHSTTITVAKVSIGPGDIRTVAGTPGTSGYSGDGGPATSAKFFNPYAVALDTAGNIYIADTFNTVVREVMAATGIITTVAGSGESSYYGDGGQATSAEMISPEAVALDAAGNLYIADQAANVIRKVSGMVSSASSTMTVLTSSLNPSTSGSAVAFTAAVSDGVSPTGTVRFASKGATISGCSAVALSSGVAHCPTSTLAAGDDAIVATYSGDHNNAGSSGSLIQVVNGTTETATITTLGSSLNPSTSPGAVTVTATVIPQGGSGPTLTGTVDFVANGNTISGCPAVAVATTFTATCTTTTLAVGTDTMVAIYSGDSNYGGSIGAFSQLVNPVAASLQFVTVTPCRVVDTRKADGEFGGPAIPGGSLRSFAIPSGACGIPATAARAYSLNVTAVPPGPLGYLTIWPAGEGQPLGSTLNSLDGRIKANAAIVPAGSAGAVSVYVSDTTDVLLDINGYFVTPGSGTLQFYPLTPCRIADTRKTTGPLGGPSLVADKERDFPVLSSACKIPTTAKAYSLNFTVVPPATGDAVGYLTVWPQGETKALVSTLNDLTGTVVANAAVVPAGTGGGVAVYASNATDLLIDVNGYFAAPGSGGLALYTLAPCRVLDTRKAGGAFSGELTVNVAGSACMPPSTVPAYVFNATVVPSGDLGYLSLWPDGESKPVVSTLNAEDGDITSNMAIVPNSDGKSDAYAGGTTQLVLDIVAYFAP